MLGSDRFYYPAKYQRAKTALMYVAEKGHLEILNILLKNGAKFELNNHRLKDGGFNLSAESTDTGHTDPSVMTHTGQDTERPL